MRKAEIPAPIISTVIDRKYNAFLVPAVKEKKKMCPCNFKRSLFLNMPSVY